MTSSALFEEDTVETGGDELADVDLLDEGDEGLDTLDEGNEFEEDVDVFGDAFGDDLADGLEDQYADYSVIGSTDDRFQIRAQARRPSTLLFPFNTICLIERATPTGFRHQGTGTLITPQVLITAKHVLQNVTPPCSPAAMTGPNIPRLRITPGADLLAANPARGRPASPGSMIVAASRFRVDRNLDYGVIVLPRPFRLPAPRGRRPQFMMLQPRGNVNTATLLTIAGYPCDKPFGTMWGHSDRIPITSVSATHLRYSIDTCPGHSGSPIWLLGNDGIRLLLGVHTTGAGGPNSRCPNAPAGRCLPTGTPVARATGQNCGVRVTCHVIGFIQGVCRAFRVTGPRVDERVFRRVCRSPATRR